MDINYTLFRVCTFFDFQDLRGFFYDRSKMKKVHDAEFKKRTGFDRDDPYLKQFGFVAQNVKSPKYLPFGIYVKDGKSYTPVKGKMIPIEEHPDYQNKRALQAA